MFFLLFRVFKLLNEFLLRFETLFSMTSQMRTSGKQRREFIKLV